MIDQSAIPQVVKPVYDNCGVIIPTRLEGRRECGWPEMFSVTKWNTQVTSQVPRSLPASSRLLV